MTTALLQGASAASGCLCHLSHVRVSTLCLCPLSRRCPSLTPGPPHAFPSHRVDNNHLLLLMIHVFRENEEQLFKVSPRDSRANKNQHSAVRWDGPARPEGGICGPGQGERPA